ncbi:MAG: hypothetical protein ACYTFY_20225 [Planctomycetota bacterium]|jgi:hypothetical protein
MISGRITVLGLVVAGIIGFTSLAAAGEGKGEGQKGKARGALKEIRKEFREECKAHFKKQREENKALKGTMQGKSVSEICAAIKENRVTQHAENMEFCQSKYDEKIAEAKKVLTDSGVSEDKISEIMKRMEDGFTKRTTHHETQYKENIALLDSLANDKDLTPEGLKEKLKAHMETQKKENQEFRQSRKEARQERRSQRKENRGKEE